MPLYDQEDAVGNVKHTYLVIISQSKLQTRTLCLCTKRNLLTSLYNNIAALRYESKFQGACSYGDQQKKGGKRKPDINI
jgi:hypothetical protein